MAGENELIQLRQVFKIPDSVIIQVAASQPIFKNELGTPKSDYKIDQTNYVDAPLQYKSQLGTTVYANIEFLSETYETNIKGVFKTTPDLRYEAILLTVGQAKKIIKTEIQGRDGTVKEYIGMDDYQVTINGIITGPNGHYPADEVIDLKKVLDAPIAIPVACTYLNNLGINSIIIEGYELAQVEGGYSYQTFSINAVSDIAQELQINV